MLMKFTPLKSISSTFYEQLFDDIFTPKSYKAKQVEKSFPKYFRTKTGARKMLMKLKPLVNFSSISQTTFAPNFLRRYNIFAPKNYKVNCN